jgi:hypothetical protein
MILISVRGQVHPRATVQLEGYDKLNNPMSSSRIKPAAFQLVAQYLDEINILYLPQI